MKILSIGNSFSEDAHTYLHQVAKNLGEDFKAVNLYIGGCSLKTHYYNVLENNSTYQIQYNGDITGMLTTIKQGLMSDDWDVITLQQASHYSAKYETYSGYIEPLAEYVKKYCPNAKIYIHQTWAYEDNSDRLAYIACYPTAKAMFDDVRTSYEKAAKAIGAAGIIPAGQAMFNASQMGIDKIHRDTFHASFGAGRYLLALVWYKALTGKDISQDNFTQFHVPVSEEERAIVIKAVNAAF